MGKKDNKGPNTEIKDPDAEIVALCQKGKSVNHDAFDMLVNKHQLLVTRAALELTQDKDEIEEIIQDTFFAAFISIKKFKGDSKFSSWLYRIGINKACDYLKKKTRHNEHIHTSLNGTTEDGKLKHDPASGELTDEELIEKEEERAKKKDKVWRCINFLDPEFKGVLVLKQMNGYSYNEISIELKIPMGTVKSRLSRARDSVMNCLKGIMGD